VLDAGEPWRFEPPAGHTVAWAFVYRGQAAGGGQDVAGELVILDQGTGAITVEAREASRLLFGSARKHEHPLVLGSHSVHTNEASLRRGVARIREVGAELRRQGRG
jgi:hypothetical protein